MPALRELATRGFARRRWVFGAGAAEALTMDGSNEQASDGTGVDEAGVDEAGADEAGADGAGSASGSVAATTYALWHTLMAGGIRV